MSNMVTLLRGCPFSAASNFDTPQLTQFCAAFCQIWHAFEYDVSTDNAAIGRKINRENIEIYMRERDPSRLLTATVCSKCVQKICQVISLRSPMLALPQSRSRSQL